MPMSRLSSSRLTSEAGRFTSEVGRFIAEVLILLPVVTLAIAWSSVVFAGLFHSASVSRHRPAVEEMMTMLLLVCASSFTIGVILFSATRQRRWTR